MQASAESPALHWVGAGVLAEARAPHSWQVPAPGLPRLSSGGKIRVLGSAAWLPFHWQPSRDPDSLRLLPLLLPWPAVARKGCKSVSGDGLGPESSEPYPLVEGPVRPTTTLVDGKEAPEWALGTVLVWGPGSSPAPGSQA